MKNRIVALYKDENGYYEDLRTIIDEVTNDGDMEHFLRQVEDLHNKGYILQECFITTDEVLYAKKLLESSLKVLGALTKVYKEHLEKLESDPLINEEVIKQTRRLQVDQEKTQMKVVGRRCSRCIIRGIEVTDEIALQCYDLYKKGLI